MSWQQWTLTAVMVLSTLVSVGTIGKKREPITPGLAVVIVITNAILIALVVTA